MLQCQDFSKIVKQFTCFVDTEGKIETNPSCLRKIDQKMKAGRVNPCADIKDEVELKACRKENGKKKLFL